MKTRIQVNGIIDTLDHAKTIRTAFASELVGKDVFEQHSLASSIDSDGRVSFSADLRFNSRADRDSIRDWVRGQMETHPVVKTWILSVKISWHDCTHDDRTPQDCRGTEYVEFVK